MERQNHVVPMAKLVLKTAAAVFLPRVDIATQQLVDAVIDHCVDCVWITNPPQKTTVIPCLRRVCARRRRHMKKRTPSKNRWTSKFPIDRIERMFYNERIKNPSEKPLGLSLDFGEPRTKWGNIQCSRCQMVSASGGDEMESGKKEKTEHNHQSHAITKNQ